MGRINRELIQLIVRREGVPVEFRRELYMGMLIHCDSRLERSEEMLKRERSECQGYERSETGRLERSELCRLERSECERRSETPKRETRERSDSTPTPTLTPTLLSFKALHGLTSPRLLDFLDLALAGYSVEDVSSFSALDRQVAVAVFTAHPLHRISKNTIAWLGLPGSFYLNACLDCQMSVLELMHMKNVKSEISEISNMKNEISEISNMKNEISNMKNEISTPSTSTPFPLDEPLILKLLDNLVRGKYPNTLRFNALFPALVRHSPGVVSFISANLIDGEFAYPPLFDNLPFVFEHSDPAVATSLAMRRPANMPLDTAELNTLHLFKTLPFSMDLLKKHFFAGLCSPNRAARMCYLDILFNYTPRGAFTLVQYILLFNYTGIEEGHIECFIAVLLYNALKPGSRSFYGSTDKLNSTDKLKLGHLAFDAFFLSRHNSTAIETLLTGLLSNLHPSNTAYLLSLFNTHFDCPVRVKLPFIRSFINVSGAEAGGSSLCYNPYAPSLKYYQQIDREMYLGLMKSRGGLREVKKLVDVCSNGESQEVLQLSFEILRKVEARQASYVMDDVCFMEGEVRGILCEGSGRSERSERDSSSAHNSSAHNSSAAHTSSTHNITHTAATFSYPTSPPHPFTSSLEECTEVDALEIKLHKILESIQSNRNVLEEVKAFMSSLSLLFYVPRSSLLFSRLLLFCSIASEIIESLIIIRDNLTESIYGRFRMWMIRHPSFYASLTDWNLFMRWRTFIFTRALGMVSENDKKKVSSELCKLNCIYATRAFKDRLYGKACSILNDATFITTVEISQNMQRILLDLESLFNLREFNTMVSLINSLNIARFSNEEKARLYYWAYKALKRLNRGTDAERYGGMSRKLSEIVENKKEDLELIREQMQAMGGAGAGASAAAVNVMGGAGAGERDTTRQDALRQDAVRDTTRQDAVRQDTTRQDTTRQDTTRREDSTGYATANDLDHAYISKLIEIINEVSVEESRPYVLELVGFPGTSTADLNSLSDQKLYYFMDQIRDREFLYEKNPLLRREREALGVFDEWVGAMGGADSSHADHAGHADHATAAHATDAPSLTPSHIDTFYSARLTAYLNAPTLGRSAHRFPVSTPLLGEFTVLRNKYETVRFMEYIEERGGEGGTFYVRVSDGTVVKITVSGGGGERERGDTGHTRHTRHTGDTSHTGHASHASHTSHTPPSYTQFMELFNLSIRSHQLEKLSFNLTTSQTASSPLFTYTVHPSPDVSFEFLWLNRLFKEGVPFHSVFEGYLGDEGSEGGDGRDPAHPPYTAHPLYTFSQAALKWRGIFKQEILSTIPSYNDFYIFRRNFINSFGPVVCFSYLLGVADTAYEMLFVDGNGVAQVPVVSGMMGMYSHSNRTDHHHSNRTDHHHHSNSHRTLTPTLPKFYFRAALQELFGQEGINGPLSMFMTEFMRLARQEQTREMARLLGVQLREDEPGKEPTAALIIGELIDPKLGATLPVARHPWL